MTDGELRLLAWFQGFLSYSRFAPRENPYWNLLGDRWTYWSIGWHEAFKLTK